MSFFAKKNLGQNFLIDEKIIDIITEIANIDSKDEVLEVGPGAGALTQSILKKKPKCFTVIEKDQRLVKILNDKYGDKINVINDDMMKFSYKEFEKSKLTIFGNLPYNISTQILAKWIKISKLEQFCKKFILMFQKEVADRIIADTNTKDYGRLSILSNWKMEIEKIIDKSKIIGRATRLYKNIRTIIMLKPYLHCYTLFRCLFQSYSTVLFYNKVYYHFVSTVCTINLYFQ